VVSQTVGAIVRGYKLSVTKQFDLMGYCKKLWHEMNHHVKNIELGKFVVMPNHVHGILLLTGNDACTHDHNNSEFMSAISPKSNTLSSIIRSYKSAVTKYCNRLELPFAWQTRFHDHVIRDENAYNNIMQYIINNPANWQEDNFYYK
jgi:REP element-mobilizing transposase RayT